MLKKIRIGNCLIGDQEPLYFIADVGANHDGDLDRAFKLIELAKEAGADAIKFQNFQADKIVSEAGFNSLGGSLSHQLNWSESVYSVYQKASISQNWTSLLREKCKEVGVEYFTSPYDFASVDHVDPYVRMYKIGSGDISWLEIIEYIAKKNKPVLLATGASDMADVERAVEVLNRNKTPTVIMQCNTNYTASGENFKFINLNVLRTYALKFPDMVLGLSDHTLGHSTVVGAVALGARVFEKHFTDDNSRIGPDHKFAMNPTTWKEMVERANEVYKALGDGIKRVEENEKETAVVQRRSLRFVKDLPKGHLLKRDDLIPLRPIPKDGIPPHEIKAVIGKRLSRDVQTHDYVKSEDLLNAKG